MLVVNRMVDQAVVFYEGEITVTVVHIGEDDVLLQIRGPGDMVVGPLEVTDRPEAHPASTPDRASDEDLEAVVPDLIASPRNPE